MSENEHAFSYQGGPFSQRHVQGHQCAGINVKEGMRQSVLAYIALLSPSMYCASRSVRTSQQKKKLPGEGPNGGLG